MKTSVKGAIIFVGVILLAFMIGDFIMKAAFFGCLMLAGMAAMINSIPPMRNFMARMSKVVDVLIFTFTVIATAQFGLNITAGLTMAGLGYTLVYGPYLREHYGPPPKKTKKLKAKRKEYLSGYDCR
jgi:hypothetical protein